MRDLSDLVPFHSGQVDKFYLLVLGQVQMYKVINFVFHILISYYGVMLHHALKSIIMVVVYKQCILLLCNDKHNKWCLYDQFLAFLCQKLK